MTKCLKKRSYTAKTDLRNSSGECICENKSMVEVSNPKTKYTIARNSTKKSSTVESETTVVLHEKNNVAKMFGSKNLWRNVSQQKHLG